MTIEAARQGFAFATCARAPIAIRRRGPSTSPSRSMRGSAPTSSRSTSAAIPRTRDYVIRREFDVAEGDAYNRALISSRRAAPEEPQLLQERQDHQRAGLGARPRRPQRRRRRTCRPANSRSAGGYSTSDGFAGARSASASATCSGSACTPRLGCHTASMRRAPTSRSSSRICSATGSPRASTSSPSSKLPTNFISYETDTIGGGLRLGFALARGSGACSCAIRCYRQEIVLPSYLRNCNNINPDFINTFPTPNRRRATRGFSRRTLPGQTDQTTASPTAKPRWRCGELAKAPASPRWSATTLSLQHARQQPQSDQRLSPSTSSRTSPASAATCSTCATTADLRRYYEVVPDVVGVLHLQGGYINGWGNDSVD